MKRYIYIVFLLLMSVQLAIAQSTRYEYWFDNDYEGRTVNNTTDISLGLDIDISKQHPGLHYFNFRTQDAASGKWGGLSHIMYMVRDTVSVASLAKYEYWLDNDYEGRTVKTGESSISELSLDISHLHPGLHYFNFRTQGSSGTWGGLAHYLFMVKNDIKDISSLEYWIDDNRSGSQTIDVNDSTVTITMDVTELDVGVMHTFNILGKSGSSAASLAESYEFALAELPHVVTPVITHSGDTITISDGENADKDYPIDYYYTTDGTKPSRSSLKYEGPFLVERNCTLKVVGAQYAHEYSEVAELKVDWFKVGTPVLSQIGKTLTMTTSTVGAEIYYKVGNSEERLYTEPLRLADQSKVTATGRKDGYFDSETVTYQPRVVKSAKPTASYDGRYLKLGSNEDGVNFYYTFDGSSPADSLDVAEAAKGYNGRITIDSLCTLRAVAIIDSMNVSDVLVYPIKYLYDSNVAYVGENGVLSKAFEWCGGIKTVENIKVEGPLNNADVDSLCAVPVLTHLDLGSATLTSGQLKSDAFAGSQLVSFISPKEIRQAGGRIFADCPKLAAVVWNSDATMQNNTFEGVNNPNLMVYVNNESLKPEGVTNVVIGGVAPEIKIVDATTGNNNFYCPQSFTATNISFVHEYKQRTVIGVNRGWETLVLPFDVESIKHEKNGTLKPFYAEGDGMPFWLMELTPDSLDFAKKVQANIPYLISMPNNPDVYSDIYNQAGKVTFSARDAVVAATQLNDAKGAGVTMRPVLQTVSRSEEVYALNVGAPDGDNPEGSVFKQNYRDVRPFEVYLLPPTASSSRMISVSSLFGTNGTTGLDDVLLRKFGESSDDIVRVYTLTGTLLKQGKRDEVIKSLPKGIYIINGKKAVVK